MKSNYQFSQKPNTPSILAMSFWVLEKILSNPSLKSLAGIGFMISLGYWAYLEIFYGVNNFRRLLGAIGMLFVLMRLFSL